MCSLDSDDSSIDCEMNGLSEGKRSEDKQGRFLNLLKKWPVVLNKSQISAVKGKKRGLFRNFANLMHTFLAKKLQTSKFQKR
jgi:hypothetical protein